MFLHFPQDHIWCEASPNHFQNFFSSEPWTVFNNELISVVKTSLRRNFPNFALNTSSTMSYSHSSQLSPSNFIVFHNSKTIIHLHLVIFFLHIYHLSDLFSSLLYHNLSNFSVTHKSSHSFLTFLHTLELFNQIHYLVTSPFVYRMKLSFPLTRPFITYLPT